MSNLIPIQPDPNNPIVPTQTPISYSPYTPSDTPISTDVKLAFLLSASPAQLRDTWVNLGSLVVTNTVRLYNKGSVFRLNEPASQLNGSVLFCDSEYTVDPSFSWDNMELADEITGQIINTETLIIDPHFTMVLSNQSLTNVNDPLNTTNPPVYVAPDPSYIPFQDADSNCKLIIDDEELNRILIEIGVPFINVQELEFSREEIINLMIWPAVQTYYKWFPIETIGAYALPTEKFAIPYPNWAFTALRAYLIKGYPIGTVTNPLYRYFDEVLMSISPRGAFSTPNLNSSRRQGYQDIQSFSTYVLERAARSGIVNYSNRQRIRFFNQGRLVKGFASARGTLEITWGSMSNLWSDIPFTQLDNVRKLAKSYVLRSFGALRMQAKSDIGTINYQEFMNRADKLEAEVLPIWAASTKPVIVRN